MHPFIDYAEANFHIETTNGTVPFRAKKYQKELAQIFENNRFMLVKKYRQGGFTTFAALWALYNCLTKDNQSYMIISPSNEMSGIVYRKLWYPSNLPFDTAYGSGSQARTVLFSNDSSISFISAGHIVATRGRRLDCIIYDEMASIRNMEMVYTVTYPCVSLGGKSIGLSTPRGKKNYFCAMYKSKKWLNYSPDIYDDPETLKKLENLHMSSDVFSEEALAKFSCY